MDLMRAFDHLKRTYGGAFERLFCSGRENLNTKSFPKNQMPKACLDGWRTGFFWCYRNIGSISATLSGPVCVPPRREISGRIAGSFPETAAVNRAYRN